MTFKLPRPKPRSYDVHGMSTAPWSKRLKAAAICWAEYGYGTPPIVLVFYLFKMVVYVGAWLFFLGFNDDVDSCWSTEAWFTQLAFYKGLIWSMVFEMLGLGCGSGPLTGRYRPPFAGALYFMRTGTIRLPYFGSAILYTRNWLDLSLYLAQIGVSLIALCLPTLQWNLTLFLCINLVIIGLRDRTVYLAARPEHYLMMLVCMLSSEHWFTGIVVIQSALWLWAAISKCTPHFPYVIAVMCSNAPYDCLRPLRRKMYRNFPEDLRPSKTAHGIAHIGTVLEFAFPLLLLFCSESPWQMVGLGLMVYFHVFILSHFPMGVPLEWNLMMIYGGFFGFGGFVDQSLSTPSVWLLAFLIVNTALVPLLGNVSPKHVSFLPSMRYYAGNWSYSVWLFRKDIISRIKTELALPVDHPKTQLTDLYDDTIATASLDAVVAFRHMHLHGRLLHTLLPKAVHDLSDYEYVDGEILGGWLLGWNFGDGHLHDHRLLGALQDRLNLSEGDLRCIHVESQPIHRRSLTWRILDANLGLIEAGETSGNTLQDQQPWSSENDTPLAQ